MIFHENCLPADNSHDISCRICCFEKPTKFEIVVCCKLFKGSELTGGVRFSKKLLYIWYSLSVSSYLEISDLMDIMLALIFLISATFSNLAFVSVSALKTKTRS